MASEAGEITRLILATHQSLTPSPFPPRRDLDVAGAGFGSTAEHTLFHDLFWPDRDGLACFVVRVGSGDEGRLKAHALKALLRAALSRHPADEALRLSLGAIERTGSVAIDAAAATLRIDTGEATLARTGRAEALCLSADAPASEGASRARLAPGDICWLGVGDVAAPVPNWAGLDLAGLGVTDELVRAALADGPAAAAVALGPRSLPRASQPDAGGRTFVLANDVAQISPLLAQVETYLRVAGAGFETLAGLDVALDEILTNIVLYAYRDGGHHEIAVEVRPDPAALRIEIRDDGQPFDPTAAAPPDLEGDLDDRPIGGLGLHLVRAVFDAVAYQRREGWNILALTKAAPGPAGRASGGAPA